MYSLMVQKTETGPTSNKVEMLLTAIHVRNFRLLLQYSWALCLSELCCLGWFVTDFSAQHIGPICVGQYWPSSWPFKIGPIRCPKRSVINHLSSSGQQPRRMKILPIDVRSVFFFLSVIEEPSGSWISVKFRSVWIHAWFLARGVTVKVWRGYNLIFFSPV